MTTRIVFAHAGPPPDGMTPGQNLMSNPSPDGVKLHLNDMNGPVVGNVVTAVVSDDGTQMVCTCDVDDAHVAAVVSEVGDRLISVDE